MEAFINYLKKFGSLSTEEIDNVLSKLEMVTVAKGSYLSETGKVSRKLAFLTKGILRIGLYDDNDEDVTRLFVVEENFAVDVDSFMNERPSRVFFQAMTDCEAIILSRQSFIELSNIIGQWSGMFSLITSGLLAKKLALSNDMLHLDGRLRYLKFLNVYPGLANQVPLSTLASYLGIDPSSLSRIRKQLTNAK